MWGRAVGLGCYVVLISYLKKVFSKYWVRNVPKGIPYQRAQLTPLT